MYYSITLNFIFLFVCDICMWSVRCLHTEAKRGHWMSSPSTLHFLSIIYVYVCVGACSCCAHVGGCAIRLHVKTQRHILYPLLCSLLYSLETGSFLNLEFFLWGQDWHSESSSASRISIPLLPSLQLGVAGVPSHVQLFTRIVGI